MIQMSVYGVLQAENMEHEQEQEETVDDEGAEPRRWNRIHPLH